VAGKQEVGHVGRNGRHIDRYSEML
jgi:hypothetical protein